jgi:hypothetical protein
VAPLVQVQEPVGLCSLNPHSHHGRGNPLDKTIGPLIYRVCGRGRLGASVIMKFGQLPQTCDWGFINRAFHPLEDL